MVPLSLPHTTMRTVLYTTVRRGTLGTGGKAGRMQPVASR